MAEKTLTFESSAHFTKIYSTTELKNASSTRQGFYAGYPSPAVGVMRFSGLADVNWKTKSIISIKAILHNGASGRYNVTKTFGLYGSNLQKDSDTTTYGHEWIDGQEVLGEFDLYCTRDTDLTLSLPNDNASLLANIETYLKSGSVDTFCLYMNETEKDGGANYSANYLEVTDASLTITFDDAISTFNYGVDDEWKPCMVYYGINGEWVPCTYWYGKNGEWTQMGTSTNEDLIYYTYPTAAMTSNSSQGCVASASSTYGSSYPAWQAFDNEETKSWASASDTGTQWIQLKMPQALKQITVEVHSRTSTNIANPVAGQVLGSNDGSTWTPIGSYSGWSKTQRGGKLGEIVCNNDTAYSYVRLTITDRSYDGHDYVAIGYMTITGGVDNLAYITYPAAAMTSNSSQGCVASASSYYSSDQAVYYAFNNKQSPAWAAKTSDSAPWIQLQMPRALKKITVKVYRWNYSNNYKGDPVSGTVMGSTDGSTWTQIGTYSGWSAYDDSGMLGEIVCDNSEAYSYVRLNISSFTSGKSYVSIGYITITGGV